MTDPAEQANRQYNVLDQITQPWEFGFNHDGGWDISGAGEISQTLGHAYDYGIAAHIVQRHNEWLDGKRILTGYRTSYRMAAVAAFCAMIVVAGAAGVMWNTDPVLRYIALLTVVATILSLVIAAIAREKCRP